MYRNGIEAIVLSQLLTCALIIGNRTEQIDRSLQLKSNFL